jgi:exosortase
MQPTSTECARPAGITVYTKSLSAQRTTTSLAALAALMLVLIAAYWTTLGQLLNRWSRDSDYTYAYFVPPFALALLWFRRDKLTAAREFVPDPTAWWWGCAFLVSGTIMRLVGIYSYYFWPDAVSFIPCLLGLFLMAGGRTAFRWSGPSIAFLLFMVPLPGIVARAMTHPLQLVATQASTFALQTVGIPALSEGNVISLTDGEIGVAEACSGLRMLLVFFAVSTAVALLIRRPWWEKALLVLSAVPIAIISNVMRITLTGVLHTAVNSEVASLFFHELAGWLMVPLAVSLIWMELRVVSFLQTCPERHRVVAEIR